MVFEKNLKNIYVDLTKLNINIYKVSDDVCNPNCKAYIDTIVSNLLFESYNCDSCCNTQVSLLDSLIFQMNNIDYYSCHKKNYSYFAQIQRLSSIIKNFKSLVCKISCIYDMNESDLLTSLFCILIKILQSILKIVSLILNIETINSLNICSKDQLLENLICTLIKEIDYFSDLVCELAKLFLKIISINIKECIDFNDVNCLCTYNNP